MTALFTNITKEEAHLNRVLNDLVKIFKSEEFNEYLINSELPSISKTGNNYNVFKGYPKGNSNRYEVYVNTSSDYKSLDLDIANGDLLLSVVVDVFIPDNAIAYIWLYQSAFIKWLLQFKLGANGVIMGIANQTYTIAEGNTANHFTMIIDILAESFTDETALLRR